MKKVRFLCVLLLLAAVCAACGTGTPAVGVVLGPHTTQAVRDAMQMLHADTTAQPLRVHSHSVQGAEQLSEAVRALQKAGCRVILCADATLRDALEVTAQANAQTAFILLGGMCEAANVQSAFDATWEGAYLLGVAAAAESMLGRLGYCTTGSEARDVCALNAFLLGARSVRADAVVVQGTSPQELATRCDMLCVQGRVQNRAGEVLTQTQLHLSDTLCSAAQWVAAGNSLAMQSYYGMGNGVATVQPIDKQTYPAAYQACADALEEAREQGGSYRVFTGPLYDQQGSLVAAVGEVLDWEALQSMQLRLEGIEGTP